MPHLTPQLRSNQISDINTASARRKRSRTSLTNNEKCLTLITFVIVVADIIMGICLFIALKSYFSFMMQIYYTNLAAYNKTLTTPKAYITNDDPNLTDFSQYDEKCSTIFEKPILVNCKAEIQTGLAKKVPILDKKITMDQVLNNIVSILNVQFQKVPSSLNYLCMGSIISERLAMTSALCVNNDNDWANLKVRSGSRQWSQGGQIHTIISVKYGGSNIVLLEVKPNFINFTPFTMEHDNFNLSSIQVTTASWAPFITSINDVQYKYSIINKTLLRANNKDFLSMSQYDNIKCKKNSLRSPGQPVYINDALIGINIGAECFDDEIEIDADVESVFLFQRLATKNIYDWLQPFLELRENIEISAENIVLQFNENINN